MNKYDSLRIIVSALTGAAILIFAGCGGGSEAEASASVNKIPVATSNETKVTVKIPAEIPKTGPMVADASGNLYIADRTKCSIIKVTPSGEASLFAGRSRTCPDASIEPKDGTGDQAEFSYPNAITIDTSGNIYVADNDNISYDRNGVKVKGSSIRKITPEGVVTQFAGSFVDSGYIDSNGKNARFGQIISLTSDDEGSIYAADISNAVVRKLQPNGDVVTYFNLLPFRLAPYFIQYNGMNKFYILSTDGVGDVFLYKNNDGITRLQIWPPYEFSSDLQVDRSNGDIYFSMVSGDYDYSNYDYKPIVFRYQIYRASDASTQTYQSNNLNKIYPVGAPIDGGVSMTVASPGVLAILDNGRITRVSSVINAP